MTPKPIVVIKEEEVKKVKVSVCQVCGGWIRVCILPYFKSNTKARNEFMKEVAKYNLAVREMSLSEWKESKIEICNCFE